MKKFFALLPALFAVAFSYAQTSTSQDNGNDISKVIEFKELDHDFGKIPYGKPAEFDLEMKNISNDTVRLEKVQAGCGCTTPQWKPGPYQPGETFKAVIGFNGFGITADGSFNKIVTVYLSNGMSQVIRFHGLTYKTPDNPAPGNSAAEKIKPANQ